MHVQIAPKVRLGCNSSLFGISHGHHTVHTVFLKVSIDLEFQDVKCLSVKNRSCFLFLYFFQYNEIVSHILSLVESSNASLASTCCVYFIMSLARTIAVCFKIESYSNYLHQKEFYTYIFCN